jgi:hypothetical protein
VDWIAWHQGYDLSPSRQARLRLVQAQIGDCLTGRPAGAIRVLSVCAGDARDLIGVLPHHPRRAAVRAWLVEANAELIRVGEQAAAAAGIADQLEFLAADATLSSTYAGLVPADLVILAGVFGNVREVGVPRLIRGLSFLCRRGGDLVWTRHTELNDGARQIAAIRDAFRENEFTETRYELTPDGRYGVGAQRFAGQPAALADEEIWFEFTPYRRVGAG